MQLGAAVELATSAFPQLFLPLACAANVAKVYNFVLPTMQFNLQSLIDSFQPIYTFSFLVECCCSNININSYSYIQGLC